jgi:hypothetical protein
MSEKNDTVCIIPCGSKKIWDKEPQNGPTKAKYVYIGPFTTKCREYAEKFYPKSWCILSAKYGFLFPDDIVPGTYNVSFNNKKSNPITLDELKSSKSTQELDKYDNIVVLGGKNYTKMVNDIFTAKNVYNPLSKYKGIGFMMHELNEAIKEDVHLK